MATSIRLDPETERRLDVLAVRTGRTKAFYLREAITTYLDELENASPEPSRVREDASPGYTPDGAKRSIGGPPMAIDDVISLAEFNRDASRWVERVQQHGAVVLTQEGRGRAVVQSFDAYRQVQDGLSMLQVATRGEADIRAQRLTQHDDVFDELRRDLRARRKSE